MRNKLTTLLVLALLILIIKNAAAATIKGEVLDAESRKALPGANVVLQNLNWGTMTNQTGEFEIRNVPQGEYKLLVSFIGYERQTLAVKITTTRVINQQIALRPAAILFSGITVTSSRQEKNPEDVALPLSVVSSEQLKKSAPLTLSDALKNEPGLSLGRDGIWGTRLVVRGLSKYNLVTLVDGNRVDTAPDLAAATSMIDLNDVERIEVVRGAGSSLYGTGAVGGVINVVTRSGHFADNFRWSGTFQGGFASANNLGTGHLRLNAQSRCWYIYLSSLLRNADNIQTPNGELPNSQFRDKNFSAKAGFRLFLNHEIKFNYQNFQANDVGIPGGLGLFPGNATVRYPLEKREMFSAELLSRNLNSRLVQSSFKYFFQNIVREVENLPYTTKLLPGTPPKRMNLLKVTPGADHNVNGVQYQSDWLLMKRHYLIAGVDFWQKEYRGHRSKFQEIQVLDPQTNAVVSTVQKEIGELPLPDSKYASLGFFAQDEFSLRKEVLTLTLGGRYDKIQIKSEEALNPLFEVTNGVRNNSPANQTVLWPANSENNQSWSANVNLLYRLTSALSFTLAGARSFRSPSLEERFAFIDLGNLVKIGDPALSPESGIFVDFGVRYNLDRLALSANIFRNELRDLVVDAPAVYESRPALKTTNVGEARLSGFDGRIDWRLWSTGTVYGSAACVKGEDLKSNTPLPLIPPFNGRLGLRWRSGLYFDLDFSANMFATQERIVTGEIRTPGYTTFDLYLNSTPLPLGMLSNEITFGIENIANRAYRNHLATNRGLIAAEPGRNLTLRWSVTF